MRHPMLWIYGWILYWYGVPLDEIIYAYTNFYSYEKCQAMIDGWCYASKKHSS